MDSLSRIKFALFGFPPSVSCLEDMNFILRVVFPTPQAPTIATEYWCGSGSRSQLGSSVLALPLPAELSAMSKIWIMFCRKKKRKCCYLDLRLWNCPHQHSGWTSVRQIYSTFYYKSWKKLSSWTTKGLLCYPFELLELMLATLLPLE